MCEPLIKIRPAYLQLVLPAFPTFYLKHIKNSDLHCSKFIEENKLFS